MSVGKANCAVCAEPLVYFEEAQTVVCNMCGKQDTGHSVCSQGHYVCDECHRKAGVTHVMDVCQKKRLCKSHYACARNYG